ncbi:RNA polymerase sigma factor [Sphingomonas sp. Leaf21]|uniref:RNA polymerase sigma factor n=1 Tax=Sphingomonas sp. Leaf21 TaxID=2876550 RepID=UPI001E2A9633|nr:sigma-70 family RNA polymerase sigma factor [Sphingomonas sp. Leaf21]
MGDTGLEGQFMEARPLLRRLLAARLGSADEAEDALQDLWLRVSGMQGGHVEQPIPFLCRMATNLATDRRIAAARRGAREGAWEDVQPQSEEYADPERIVAGRHELARAHARIAEMPERMRRAFTLFRFEEMPQRSIAEDMGITVSAVEKLLRRAYHFLQENDGVGGADRADRYRPGHERSADR